jgi:hypothetical protein
VRNLVKEATPSPHSLISAKPYIPTLNLGARKSRIGALAKGKVTKFRCFHLRSTRTSDTKRVIRKALYDCASVANVSTTWAAMHPRSAAMAREPAHRACFTADVIGSSQMDIGL